jgi:hypothetical protein
MRRPRQASERASSNSPSQTSSAGSLLLSMSLLPSSRIALDSALHSERTYESSICWHCFTAMAQFVSNARSKHLFAAFT